MKNEVYNYIAGICSLIKLLLRRTFVRQQFYSPNHQFIHLGFIYEKENCSLLSKLKTPLQGMGV